MDKGLTRRNFVGLAGAAGLAFASLALVGCGEDNNASTTPASDDKAASDDAKKPASSAGSNALRFVTGGESGTYYAFGSVIAQHATNNTDTPVTGVVGNGSQANIMELEDGNAELAFCQSDVMAYAYNGTNLFEDTGKVDCFSTLGLLYEEQVQIVTCDENIKTVADLKGKTVSIGAAGSGVYFNAIDILGVYGISESDITPTYQSFGDSADALKDGKIDAAFIVAGAPTTAITELATSGMDFSLVSLDQEHVDALHEKYPFLVQENLPAGTYEGVDTETICVAVEAALVASTDMSEDAVYELTKTMFENLEELGTSHAKFQLVSAEKAAENGSVPMHPGAEKYYKEIGLL